MARSKLSIAPFRFWEYRNWVCVVQERAICVHRLFYCIASCNKWRENWEQRLFRLDHAHAMLLKKSLIPAVGPSIHPSIHWTVVVANANMRTRKAVRDKTNNGRRGITKPPWSLSVGLSFFLSLHDAQWSKHDPSMVRGEETRQMTESNLHPPFFFSCLLSLSLFASPLQLFSVHALKVQMFTNCIVHLFILPSWHH